MKSSTLLGLAVLLQGCSSHDAYGVGNVPIETVSIMEDGIRILLKADRDPGYYCPGANSQWHGNTVDVTFIRAPIADKEVGVAAPALDVPGADRLTAVFLHTGHIEETEWITLRAARGREARKITMYRRQPNKANQADAASRRR